VSLRLIASARPRVHHDALDWARRVAANGGAVSQATLRAVSRFCDAIDRAAIRDRFFRLNLFCGNSLSAALVPIFRSQSLGGTQYGNTTDTNNNFVSTDYVETGANGGLLGNTTSKSLSPGFQTQHFPSVSSTHHAFWWRGGTVAQNWRAIGCFGPTNDHYTLDVRTSAGGGVVARVGNNTNTVGTNYAIESAGSFIAARTSHTDVRLYYNGSSVATSSTNSSTTVLSSTAIEVMSGGGTYFPYRSCGYSFGAGMTQPQAAAFHSAWAAFQAALGRGL
jgi:hypothetical protein